MRLTNSPLALALASAVLASLANSAGCADQPDGLSGGTYANTGGSGNGTGAGNGTAGIGGGVAQDPKVLFEALLPTLEDACGSCHKAGGIADTPFLADPDPYESMSSWPGVVTKDPTQSIILTYPRQGSMHTGTSLDSSPLNTTLLPKLTEWLTNEAAVIANPTDDKPQIPAQAPIMGFNAIYLTPLDPNLEGVAITFNASKITDSSLMLSSIQVHTTTQTGVHMVHPLLVVYPKGAEPDPDPVDNFGGIDERFDKMTATELGQGTVILDNWVGDAKLSFAFESVEAWTMDGGTGGAGGGGGGGCSDLADFNSDAKPQFQNNCFTCHGGGNPAAKAAVDMSKLQSDAAAACAQIKNRINPGDPPSSQIFVTTNPDGNAAHPFKFGGSTGNFNNFKSAISPWIGMEQ